MTLTIPKPAPPKRRVDACPHPEKQAFPTEGLSEDKRREQLAAMVGRGWTKHFPIRSYRCECTYWHWTSKLPIPKKR